MRQRKTSQIQIRVSPRQKAELVRRARAAGMEVSGWMLSRLVPDGSARFRDLARDLAKTDAPSFVLSELGDFLSCLGTRELTAALALPPDFRLDELRANQLGAMVETTAARLGVSPPPWVGEIPPLRLPWFASSLTSLRLHLLTQSPPAFRRRNLFVDSTLGDRV